MAIKSTPLQIAVVVKYFYPVAAGIETNILETYSVLSSKNSVVTIFTSRHTHTESNIFDSTQVFRGLNIRRYSKFWFWPQINLREIDILALHNFDVYFLPLLVYSLFLKLTGQKKFALVITPHGGFTPEWRVFRPLARMIKWIYHHTLAVWLVNSVSDAVRAVSVWEQNEMRSYGINSSLIHVISNGLENEAFLNLNKLVSQKTKNLVSELDKYIIQIGRIYPIKNYETVIKCLPYIPKDIKFAIVGPVASNLYKQKLISLAQKLDVGDRVVFLGVVRGVDKYYLIKNALAMVHMAIWESFCNVVHEALSQATPTIVADNTALSHLVTPANGFKVPTFDHLLLSQTINWVLDPKNSRSIDQMRRHNLSQTRDQTWTNTAVKMDTLYRSLL